MKPILYGTLMFVLFNRCAHVEEGVSVAFTPVKMVQDTVIDENGDTLLLNEYYTLLLKNDQYDTLSFNIDHLGNSVYKAMLPSKVEYYIGDSLSGDELMCNMLSKNHVAIKVPKHQQSTILLLMPEFSDVSRYKIYSYLIECVSLNKKEILYMRIESKYGLVYHPINVNISD